MITTDDWRLDDGDIDMIRLVCGDASGGMGVRSAQGGIEAGSIFAPIDRPDELRCGPVYVKTPKHEGGGYELTDEHLRNGREYARARKVASLVGMRSAEAWRTLAVCFGRRPIGKLEAFHDLAPLILEQPIPAAVGAHHRAVAEDRTHGDLGSWLVHLSDRVVKARRDGRPVNPEDLRAVREIGDEVRPVLAVACRLWREARAQVFHSRRPEVRRG